MIKCLSQNQISIKQSQSFQVVSIFNSFCTAHWKHAISKIDFFANLFCFFVLFSFSAEYSTFAEIEIGKRGNPQLIWNGSKFGQSYKVSDNDFTWRCTSNANGRRCNARLRAKLIEGFAVLKSTICYHNHVIWKCARVRMEGWC